MAQAVCVLLDDATQSSLSAIAGDRSRPLKHILRARIVLLSSERLSVQDVARPSWRQPTRRLALAAALRRGGRRGPAAR